MSRMKRIDATIQINKVGSVSDAINEALRENGNVIVMGCLGEKKHLIEKNCKNLIAITGSEAFSEVMDAVHNHIPKPHNPYADLIPPQGVRLTPKHYSYIKISEGCNHKCSFCIIPSMRGKLVSRPIGEVMKEAENLVASGTSELLIISASSILSSITSLSYISETSFLMRFSLSAIGI